MQLKTPEREQFFNIANDIAFDIVIVGERSK